MLYWLRGPVNACGWDERMNERNELIALVDLGGSQIRVAISRPSGEFVLRKARPTPAREGPEAILRALLATTREAISAAGGQVSAISVAAPGPLDPKRGVIVAAPNLAGWVNVPLVDIMKGELGLPVLLGNDANLAALGEQAFGAARGHKDVIYLTISTGICGGVIVDGKLLIGSHGYGAELGHNSIMHDGPRCGCGNYGCIEALASGTAIARMAREALERGERSIIASIAEGDPSRITARVVAEAAQAGDALAREIYRQAGYYLGVGIVNFLYTFDPTVVVLGGGVTKAGPLLFDPVIETVRKRAPQAYWEHCAIVPAALGDDVGLMGALAYYLSESRPQGS